MQEQLLIMFIVIGGAAVIPFFSRRLRMPSAAFEIIYGLIIFNFFVEHKPEWFLLLKDLGIIYLMFIAGMELDMRRLFKTGRFIWYLMIPALSMLLMPLIFIKLGYSFYIGIAVSVISVGIIIPVLKEMKLLQTDLGTDIIGIALTGELLSIILLTGIDIFHRHGLTVMAFWGVIKVMVLFLLAALFLKVLYVMAWWTPERVEKVMESEDPVEEGLRAVIAVVLAGALLAYYSGIEPILGSFMAGLIFSHVFKNKGRFEEKINAIGFGFFTPFFFIGVGAHLDIELLRSFESISFAAFLSLMVLSSNIFPILFSRYMKTGYLESLGTALILSAPLTLIIVAGTLGEKMGLITYEEMGVLVLTAVISGIVYPFLFRIISRKFITSSSEPLQQS